MTHIANTVWLEQAQPEDQIRNTSEYEIHGVILAHAANPDGSNFRKGHLYDHLVVHEDWRFSAASRSRFYQPISQFHPFLILPAWPAIPPEPRRSQAVHAWTARCSRLNSAGEAEYRQNANAHQR